MKNRPIVEIYRRTNSCGDVEVMCECTVSAVFTTYKRARDWIASHMMTHCLVKHDGVE